MTDLTSIHNLRQLAREGYKASAAVVRAFDAVGPLPSTTAHLHVLTQGGGSTTLTTDEERILAMVPLLVSDPEVTSVRVTKS